LNIVLQKLTADYNDQKNKTYKSIILKIYSKIESDNLIIEPALQTTIESKLKCNANQN
jgi:hypothetical protein